MSEWPLMSLQIHAPLNQRLYRNPFARQSSDGKNVDWMEKVSDDQHRQG
jgi:hypothetical protein